MKAQMPAVKQLVSHTTRVTTLVDAKDIKTMGKKI